MITLNSRYIYNKVREMRNTLLTCSLFLVASGFATSCSDEMEGDSYYTFTGQMMSEYLQQNENFSEFATIVERAGLMKLLSAHGAYTCFAPTNDAVNKYIAGRGLNSINDLSDADCDTIALTHLVKNVYNTSDMNNGVLPTANMNRRYIEIEHVHDNDSNDIVTLNRSAHIIYSLQNDSVENGIMQPVDGVLESSNRMLVDVMKQNPNISIFTSAIIATHISDSLTKYKDASYNQDLYPRYKYTSHVNKETATAPDEKKYGFTAFVPTNDVLGKYDVVEGDESLKKLWELACSIYDPMYPADAGQPYHDFDHITDYRNPLFRFVAYHILDRDVKGWNYLTPLNDIGIVTSSSKFINETLMAMNPVDWYETMLPHTMMKFEKLMVLRYAGSDQIGQRYINRRTDDEYSVRGAMVSRTVEKQYSQDALNGRYFYVDDILKFDSITQNVVDNTRIRMDFSTVFPELMTNDIRQNGDPTKADLTAYDETGRYGRNYYFPQGYLKNVTCSGYFIYRRPHDWYDSYEGDEMNLFGNYDLTFKIPPVPYEGDWQIRLGYASESTRGIAQIYFDGEPQGIPLDMTKSLSDADLLGSDWVSDFTTLSLEALSADQKAIKNKGFYRGPAGGNHHVSSHEGSLQTFAVQANTIRIVLCTVHLDPNKDHFIRIRSVSSKKGNDNEFDLDYMELVPKSVYGVTDSGQIEDML